jgi:release factor glutamine methyltransferase
MENKPATAKSILGLFRVKLQPLYELPEIDQFVYILFEEWKGWSRADVHLNFDIAVNKEEETRFLDALEQLQKNRPIQYIIGVTHFLDVTLTVREGVLIPRPETEELTAMILRDYKTLQYGKLSLLDIGTGSGCIPVAIKKRISEAEVTAIDKSEMALQVAGENAKQNGCDIRFLRMDILDRESWSGLPSYSVIVSNPPYIAEQERISMRPNVLGYEPGEALFVNGNDPLLFYRAIAGFAFLHLLRPGLLYLEINERYGREVAEIILSEGFDSAEILQDLQGKDRFVKAQMTAPSEDNNRN